ncbi:UDP-N-acetylmuramoyl-L-alanine--D-glutamate ligase [Pigmentibacter sp. JX0631]|uniref:UDP-N-acetylmuramoyl-L-alanine--D-glutamate ligase n=1 Tax=Pigmentibacter sp. JX0631 TaxID=2976982 RepID=UPI0024686D3D|nr:UDP-N-acetylmuramoyl-L-alanine--D-glutamate ligase [Pigmentibacter sp. JX0631]WGL61443.1 UDP-N-acetylmuramoyl-L-alanine--D-glutamate ligase [Pigmentibacter sp. JX0631]
MSIEDLKDLNFYVAGAGVSGIAIAKLLKKNSINVFLIEEKTIQDNAKTQLKELGISFEESFQDSDKLIKNCHILIISPGILLNNPLILACKCNNIPVISEIEAASWFIPKTHKIIAVTGTNGKSSTTNYLSQLLNKDYKAVACGNIGISLSEVILNSNDRNTYVIELSSYQLESTLTLKPFCSIFLNIQNDHLQRYENISEYLKAKWRLVLLTDDNGYVIIEKEVLKLAILHGLSMPKAKIIILDDDTKEFSEMKKSIINYSRFYNSKILPNALYKNLKNLDIYSILLPNQYLAVKAIYFSNNSLKIQFNSVTGKTTWIIKQPCLPGKHNMYNILAASLCGLYLGMSEEQILNQWEETSTNYQHLPHRLEKINLKYQTYIDENKYQKNLLIINDSKATNVESTLVALKSFNNPIRLLIGGEAKGDSYLPIADFFGRNVVKIYPFGQAAPQIVAELKDFKNYIANTSEKLIIAADLALTEAQDNEIILLSPACSSFDEFKNFEHRGNIFRSWALSHLKG